MRRLALAWAMTPQVLRLVGKVVVEGLDKLEHFDEREYSAACLSCTIVIFYHRHVASRQCVQRRHAVRDSSR